MLLNFAELDPNTNRIKRVIQADCKERCESILGGKWEHTYWKANVQLGEDNVLCAMPDEEDRDMRMEILHEVTEAVNESE